MPDITSYTDPGVLIAEVAGAAATSISDTPQSLCIVGRGSTSKRITDEAVVRGRIGCGLEEGEVLTVAAIFPHIANLVNTSDQKKSNTILTKTVGVVTTTLADAEYNFNSGTQIEVTVAAYEAGATWMITYVAIDLWVDGLDEAPIEILSVGNYPGTSYYTEGTDFQITGDCIDWSILTDATMRGTQTATYNLTTDYLIRLQCDTAANIPLAIDCGKTAGNRAATSAQNVVDAINADALFYWGVNYSGIATVDVNRIRITCPSIEPYVGAASWIEFTDPTSNDATFDIFGLSESGYPHTYYGVGKRPGIGATYYVTYLYTRPSTDYNNPMRFFTDSSCFDYIGYPFPGNDLAIAAYVSFLQNPPNIWIVQVEDSDDDGVYTALDYRNGVDASEEKSEITELVVLNTLSNVLGYSKNSVVNESSFLIGHYRALWAGVERDMEIGDPDTAGTLTYIARQTLQVPATPVMARGRFQLIAPPNWELTYQQEDGTQTTVSLDSTYAACSLAAKHTSLPSPADTLLRKELVGYDECDTYLAAERQYLASNGVLVVTYDAGLFKLLDPITTDTSADKYREISARAQKDQTTKGLKEHMDSNLVGIVPSDLDDFISTVKANIAVYLSARIDAGAIAPFRNADGTVRPISPQKDIVVWQSTSEPTKFFFRYFYFLRYPAKRFNGDYSVDSPFWIS